MSGIARTQPTGGCLRLPGDAQFVGEVDLVIIVASNLIYGLKINNVGMNE